jgi:hypothetical protein
MCIQESAHRSEKTVYSHQSISKQWALHGKGTARREIGALTAFLLDVQGATSHEIAACEEIVCDFFRHVDSKESWRSLGDRVMQQAFEFFNTHPVPDVVFCVASLQRDLLEHGGFTADEQRFLQRQDETALYELTGHVIDGFMLGTEVTASSTAHRFSEEEYRVKI